MLPPPSSEEESPDSCIFDIRVYVFVHTLVMHIRNIYQVRNQQRRLRAVRLEVGGQKHVVALEKKKNNFFIVKNIQFMAGN